MQGALASWSVVVLALVAANLPFVSERVLLVWRREEPKSLGLRALELAFWAAVTLAAGAALEAQIGQRQPQRWEFYAAFAFLFITFAFPGFVWRYLRRRGRAASPERS